MLQGQVSKQGGLLWCLVKIIARNRIISDGPPPLRVPHHQSPAFTRRRRALDTNKLASVLSNQHRAVGPVPDEVLVEPSVLDHAARDRHRQDTVGARTHRQPLVGGYRKPCTSWINNNQSRATPPGTT